MPTGPKTDGYLSATSGKRLGGDQEDSNVPVQVIVSGLDSITNQSLRRDISRRDETSPDPDYIIVSKKAFEAEMNNKDDQISTLMNSVSNLQSQVQLLKRQLDLKDKIPVLGTQDSSDRASSQGCHRTSSLDRELLNQRSVKVRKLNMTQKKRIKLKHDEAMISSQTESKRPPVPRESLSASNKEMPIQKLLTNIEEDKSVESSKKEDDSGQPQFLGVVGGSIPKNSGINHR